MKQAANISTPKLWIVLARAYRSLVDFLEGGILVQGVSISDFMVLEVLLHKGPLTMEAIGDKTWLASASMNSAVDRLETRGLVRRGHGPNDQHPAWVIELTKGGHKLSTRLYERHERDIEAVMGSLSSEERSQLYHGLKKIGLYGEKRQLARFKDRPGGLAPWQLRRATDYLAKQLSASVSITEIAAKLRLSQSQFRRAFKVSMGIPPYRWLLNVRIAKAQELLRDGVLSLVQIALASGFADQSHFSRVFQKIVGVSPGTWQRGHRP